MAIKSTQLHRLNRVINHVQTNCLDDLNLLRLADVACLSKYHFVRVFDAHLGQTPLRYLNRVRLERAARQLIVLPNAAIGRIATRCGFESHSSFSRAFSRHFDCAPQDLKKDNLNSDPEFPITRCDQVCAGMIVRVEHRPAIRVAYIRHFGSYHRDGDEITRIGGLIRDWAESRSIPNQRPLVGICPDNRRITLSRYCVYDVGVPVDSEVVEDDVVSILTIPAGKYAIANVRCRNEQVISAWNWLCTSWRESYVAPYIQHWNYETFPQSSDGNLNPEKGVNLCLRLSK